MIKNNFNENLLKHKFVKQLAIIEPYPVGKRVNGLYEDENEWYTCTIMKVINPSEKYLVEFEGFEGEEYELKYENIDNLPEKLKDTVKIESKKFEDPLMANIVREEVPEWYYNMKYNNIDR
eukprot:UN02298